jgi:hypothetical protein
LGPIGQIREPKSVIILSEARDLKRSITPVDDVKSFLAKWLYRFAEKMQEEASCKAARALRWATFVPGSATRVPAGRNCCDLFRGIVAAPTRSEPSLETNPLHEAAFSKKKGRVTATCFVSRKIELP